MITNNFNKLDLWRIWLLIFTLILQIYLIFTTIKDYLNLKSISFDPLYGGEWSHGPMGLKLSCLLCSITFLPLIVITSVIVTGNLANDGHVLGKSIDNNHFIIDSDSKGQMIIVDLYKTKTTHNKVFCASRRFIKQQFIPVSIFLQILSGFCYMAPLPFIEAQQIQHKALGLNYMWHTDLDFLIDTDKNHEDFARGENFRLPMRPAYFNMIYCLSLFSLQYPSVFWKTNRSFCLLFYLIIIILSIHILLDYSATSILIRLSVPEFLTPEIVSNFHPISISLISILGSLVLVILQMTIFNYGIAQYVSSLTENRQNLRLQYKAQQTKKSVENEDCSNISSDSAGINESDSSDNRDFHSICIRFRPHLAAILFGSLAMGMKAPLLLHQWKLYSKTGDQVMYTNVVVAAIFSVLWLITWFSFTVNNNWRFKVNSSFKESIKESCRASVGEVTCNNLPTTPTNATCSTVLLANAGSPTYATCRPIASSSLQRVIVSPNHQHPNQLPLDENDLTNCYNYVLLHKANNAAHSSNGRDMNAANYSSTSCQSNKSREATSPTFVNVEGKIINTDDLYGSEISSESNFSRSLTAQEKSRYTLLPHDPSEGMVNRLLLNRYYSMENPNAKRIPFVRSPLLSYQFSTESSPSEPSRKQMNNQSLSKVTFTDRFIGAEPDLITHKYPVLNISDIDRRFEMNDLSPTLEQMRTEFLRSDPVVMESYLKEMLTPSPSANNETIIICGNNKVDNSPNNTTSREMNDNEHNISHDFLRKLNGIDDNNEDERLCSQV